MPFTELLHKLFDPYGVEQLVVYPPIISEDGHPCVAADVRFRSERSAAQAYANWDGRCIYYRCCRLQMWIGLPEGLPAPSSAAATPATAATVPLVVAPAASIDTSAVAAAPCVAAAVANSGTGEWSRPQHPSTPAQWRPRPALPRQWRAPAVAAAPCVAAAVAEPRPPTPTTFNTTGGVVAPVQASYGTSEVVTASLRLADPPAPTTTITKSLGGTPAVPIDSSALVPVPCSTDCAAQATSAITDFISTDSRISDMCQLVTAPSGLAEPTATVPDIEESPAAVSDVPINTIAMVPASSLTNHAVFPKLDNDDGEYDASGDNSSVNAVPFHVTPTISLTAGAHGDSPSTKLVVSALTVLESIGDISVINDNSTKDAPGAMEEEHMNCPTPWPPPYLYLSWCDSSPRPIPWPSFAILPPGSQFWVSPLHICLHYEPDREKDFTNLQRKDRDDQFNSRSVSLNVLEKFLKKPCTEPEEAIVSGLISKGATSVFKLWHVAWALPIFVPSKFARRGMEGTTPCRVLGIMRCFQLQRHALLFAYFAYMSLDSSSFVCAREELFWEREELELNDRVSYMLEQYNDNSICGIETELQSLCESTCRPLIQVAAIPHSNKEMELRMAARELCILLNDSLQHLDDSVPCCVLQCRFVLILWKIEWSLHWEHSENARTGFNNNLLLDVIKANLIFLCYGAGGIATWSVFTTTFRPAVASALIDTMKRNNSKRSCRTLILTFLQASDVIGCELWSQFGTMIMLVWSSPSMALLNGGKQGSNLYKLSPALLFRWQHVKNTKWSWDPGGCAFALCSSERTWPTLHYHAHLLRPSLQCSGAFLIWLVAWILVGFELSTFRGQAPFQEGRDVLRADCSYKVYVSRHDYIHFVNQIPVGHEYYLNKACYFNTVCSDSSKTKEVHMPWDPGKSVLQCLLKIRLGDKPSFKKGGMLGPSPSARLVGPMGWARSEELGPAHNQLQIDTYKYPARGNEEGIQVGSETAAANLSLPPRLCSSSPFHACSSV